MFGGLCIRKNSVKTLCAKCILIILIIANLGFIWANSAKESTESNKSSKSIAQTVTKKVVKDYDTLPKKEQEKAVSRVNVKIRSMAHFAEFIPLGLFSFLLFFSFFGPRRKNLWQFVFATVLISCIFCALCALGDEIHQIFVKGRSFQVEDILTDTLGSFCGCAFVVIVITIFKRKLIKE